MIAPIPPIGAFTVTPGFGVPNVYGLAATPVDKTYQSSPAVAPQGGSFGTMLADKINELNGLHRTSDELAIKAVTGDASDIHDYTIASNEAGVATQLTVAVRNRAVEAFQEIMRMQL